MGIFTVDPKICKRDGLCVSECPRRIIMMKDPDSVPVPRHDADEQCINCGHCVTVCPHGALTLKTMRPDECPPVQKGWSLMPEQIEKLLQSRRSIRTYRDKTVEQDLISRLIDIARFAPSGSNAQSVRWMVFYEPGEVRRLVEFMIEWMRDVMEKTPDVGKGLNFHNKVADMEGGFDSLCWSAPHLIVVYSQAASPTAAANCATALAYMELAAPSFDLGTCWSGYFTSAANSWPPLQKHLGFPDGDACMGALMIGYPQFTYQRIPIRNEAQVNWI
jgi:nitroreductase/NAD-dependent dihydropyrimidine dehydrogenase PreA subunit